MSGISSKGKLAQRHRTPAFLKMCFLLKNLLNNEQFFFLDCFCEKIQALSALDLSNRQCVRQVDLESIPHYMSLTTFWSAQNEEGWISI